MSVYNRSNIHSGSIVLDIPFPVFPAILPSSTSLSRIVSLSKYDMNVNMLTVSYQG